MKPLNQPLSDEILGFVWWLTSTSVRCRWLGEVQEYERHWEIVIRHDRLIEAIPLTHRPCRTTKGNCSTTDGGCDFNH